MTLRTPAVALAAIALFALPAPANAAAGKGSEPAVREFTGTVVSVAGKGKAFRLRRAGRASVLVRVSRKTRVARGAKPRKGRVLVVKARRHKKAWLARSVRLVPVVADDGPVEEEDPIDDEPIEDQEEGTEGDSGLDLDDPLGDLLGDPSDSGDEGE